MPTVSPRPYQLIVFGATGFTGQLVAAYLAEAYGTDQRKLRWGIGGRDADKLADVRHDLGDYELPTFIADSHEPASLHAMCTQADAICSTVGPYAKHGEALVAACVGAGTDYCDLTGEVPFIRRMIDRHHAGAKEKGVRIVNACGFDSIPSDLGTYFLQQQAQSKRGEFCGSVRMAVTGAKGGFSGGTYASLVNVLAEADTSPEVAGWLRDPYALNGPQPAGGCTAPDVRGAEYRAEFDAWTAPFVMAGINTRVVRRSVALREFDYGRDFCYQEMTATGKGLRGRLAAKLASAGLGAVLGAAPGSKLASLVQRFAPEVGEGPGKRKREAGFFRMTFVGTFADGETMEVKVSSDRDPGYGSTSRMLGEAAVALAETRGKERPGGVLTPSVALGEELLARLPGRAGVRFGLGSPSPNGRPGKRPALER